jgi:hypothetical protein
MPGYPIARSRRDRSPRQALSQPIVLLLREITNTYLSKKCFFLFASPCYGSYRQAAFRTCSGASLIRHVDLFTKGCAEAETVLLIFQDT